MTFMSMQLLDYPEGASREALETGGLATSRAQDFNSYARECRPYGLRAWAQARDIRLYYVDNCWVRAAVTGRQVQEFIDGVLQGAVKLADGVEADKRYLLEAEEF